MVDGPHQGHELRMGPGFLSDDVQIPGGGVVVGIREAVGVGKPGVLALQRRRLVVHLLHKGLNGAAHRLRQDIAPLVGGGEHDAVEQLLHRQLLPHLDAGGAAVGGDGGHRRLRGGEHRVHGNHLAVNGLQHQQAGHNLRQAGGVEPLVDVPGVEDLLRVRVDEQGGLGLHLPVPHVIGGGAGGGRQGQRQNQAEKKRKKTANFHIILHKIMVYW